MNDLDYLNQISVKTAPAKTGFFDKKTKIMIMALGGVFLLAIILMIALAGSSDSAQEPTEVSELQRVNYRATEINNIYQKYNDKIKSSDLRSIGVSLSAILTELIGTTSSYLTDYGVEGEGMLLAPTNDVKSIEDANQTLENAALNGILDRRYAIELNYQVSYLLVIENSVISMSANPNLQNSMKNSYESLSKVNESLASFSENK